jgi:hypothetical protein
MPSTFVVALLVIAAVAVAVALRFFAATRGLPVVTGVEWAGAVLCGLLAAMLMPVAVASTGRALQVALLIAAALATGAWFLVRPSPWRRIAALAALSALTGAFAL